MAKLLKLQGCGSFVSPRVNNEHIQKGQVIRVNDDVADKLLEGREKDAQNNEIQHFAVVSDDTPVDFDFGKEEKKVQPIGEIAGEPEPAPKPVAEPEPVKEESAKASKKATVQRKARSPAAKK
jgi:hypothetical protein